MVEPISVQISDYELENCKDEVYRKGFVLSKLRNAGIPVIGVLDFRGVASGTLRCFDFTHKHEKLFVWEP
ncbi:MAG: hypothetical protein ACXV8O_01430 [Methylobacter sp.]